MSVYFRWTFIFLVTSLLIVQLTLGYRKESIHAFILILLYFISNTVLWYAVIKRYNPRYLGFLSAILDVGVICSHLLILSLNHDQLAVTSAATLFLMPVLFLLYTFRLDRLLMVFLIVIALAGLSLVYFTNFAQDPEFYRQSISISPTAHFFRIAYILFIGILCIYLQHFMFHFIDKQLKIACEKADAELKIRIEEEKNNHSRQLISQERALNKKLENEILKIDSSQFELMAVIAIGVPTQEELTQSSERKSIDEIFEFF